MDPNETLRRLREWASGEIDLSDPQQTFADLDGWLSRGGFLPTEWRTKSQFRGNEEIT